MGEGKEIRPYRSLYMYTRVCTYIHVAVHIYTYVRTGNSPCQVVYSLQRTCIIQADTCAMPSDGRCPPPPSSFRTFSSRPPDSELASWRNKNATGRESAVLPCRRRRRRRRLSPAATTETETETVTRTTTMRRERARVSDARKGNVISLGH